MFVITGGASGIGQALALELVSRNKQVFIIGRRARLLKAMAERSSSIQYCVADVSTADGRKKIQTALTNTSIEALIHSAGTIDPIAALQTIDPDAWEQIIQINLLAPFRLTQLLLPHLQGGRVLHMGSGAAYFPVVGWSGYCVSKAALAMLTRCAQSEIQDPAFASVMPGITQTAMTASIRDAANAMRADQHQFHQMLFDQDRLIQPGAVAAFLAWLLLEVDTQTFVSKEWDIYDTSHHKNWLRLPHQVPQLE